MITSQHLLAAAIALVVVVAVIATQAIRRRGGSEVVRTDGHGVVVMDSKTGEISSQFSLGASPAGMAEGEGSIWISNSGGHTVSRIDATTHSVLETIEVGSGPGAVAIGDGHVWVANNLDATVSRIDPQTNREVQTISVGNGPAGLAYGEGSIWVANGRDGTVSRIDSVTGRVSSTIGLDHSPTDVAIGGGSVWVTSSSGNTLFRIDPQTNEVIRTINVGTGASGVAVGDGDVWVANSSDGTVSRVDAKKNTVIATIPVGSGPRGVLASDEAVWVGNESDGTLSKIDPRTNEVVRTINTGSGPEGLAMVDGSLWVGIRASGSGHRGGTLILQAETPEFESIDPAIVVELSPPTLLDMTNDGLVGLRHVGGRDGTQLVPNLAVSLPIPTDGGRTYTFELRPNIHYSTGTLVRPEDFRNALERAFKMSSPGTGYFEGIVGGMACVARPQNCDLSRGIVTNSEADTVTFHLADADPDFFYKLTLPFSYAVPASTPNEDIGTKPVPATGPYMIESYEPGKQLRLVRNPRFHEWSEAAQPDGYPDEIVWRLGVDQQEAVTAIERGDADWMLSYFAPPANRLSEIETRYASQVHADPLMSTDYFVMNTEVAPFDDVRVRRALNFAIDRGDIVQGGGGLDLARPTCQVLPPNLPGHEPYCPYTVNPGPSGEWIAPDLPKARRLVDASDTTGMTVKVVTDRFGINAPHVVSALKKLGYRASLRVVPSHRYNEYVGSRGNRVQIASQGWIADYPAPSNFIDLFLSCRARSNHSGFCDPEIDKRIKEALGLQQTDPQRAGSLWAKIDRAIVDQAPWVPTVTPLHVGFVSERVGNYQFHPQWGVLIDQLWVVP